METRQQLLEIGQALVLINGALESILHLQFGIEDKAWVEAVSALEGGYAKVHYYIQERLRQEIGNG